MSYADNVDRSGETWIFTFVEKDIAIGFERVRETRDGIDAEILVTRSKPGPSGKPALISRRRVNLLSTVTRTSFAKDLTDSTPFDLPTWKAWLEEACNVVVEQLRAGEPILRSQVMVTTMAPVYLIDHFLPENETTLLSADGESGKSWLAVAIAVALARNTQLLPGITPTRVGVTLYLDWETGPNEIRRRQTWIERGLGLTTTVNLLYRTMARGIHEDIDFLRDEIRARQIDLVIIDSLAPAVADDLDAGHTAVKTMTALRQLPCTRLVLAHVSKSVAQQTNGRGRTFGSVQFENQARSVWEMRHEEAGKEVALFHRKANVGPHQESIAYRQKWNDRDYTYRIEPVRLLETTELVHYANLRTRCQMALRDGKKELNALADLVQAKPESLRVQLTRWPEFQHITYGAGRGAKSEWGLKAADGSVAPETGDPRQTTLPEITHPTPEEELENLRHEDTDIPF